MVLRVIKNDFFTTQSINQFPSTMIIITTLNFFDDEKFPPDSKRVFCNFTDSSRGMRLLGDVNKLFSKSDVELLRAATGEVALVSESVPLFNTLVSNFPNLSIVKHSYFKYAPDCIIATDNFLRMNVASSLVAPASDSRNEQQMPSLIDTGIYLGNIDHATTKSVVQEAGINVIINCTESLQSIEFDGVEFHRVSIKDSISEDAARFFDETSDLIDAYLADGKKILIHCAAGISRSPTILAAYLMRSRGMSCDEALEFIRRARPIVDPNLGFVIQLCAYEARLKQRSA